MSSAVVKTLGNSRYSVISTPKEKNVLPQPNWFWNASTSQSLQGLAWVKMDCAGACFGMAEEFVQAVSLRCIYIISPIPLQNTEVIEHIAILLYNEFATQWVWYNKVMYVHTRDLLPQEVVFSLYIVI